MRPSTSFLPPEFSAPQRLNCAGALLELIERLGRRREPFDVAIPPGWFADFLDPAQYLNVLLDGRAIQAEQNINFSYFDDDAYVRRLARIERLAGVRRVLAYGELDVETARDSAPLIAYANATSLDLFSERVGCPGVQPRLWHEPRGAVPTQDDGLGAL